jgi:hypothetical protein
MRMIKFLLAGTAMLTTVAAMAASPQQPAAPANSPAAAAATKPGQAPTANAPASTATTASASGGVAAGATVRDTSGGTVGTIESVDGQYAVLATGKNKVRLPLSSFGRGADGPIIAMTQAQVDAAASAAAAKTATP